MLRDPIHADRASSEHDGTAAGPVVGRAILAVTDRVQYYHARRGEAVGGDDGAQVVQMAPKLIDGAPHVAPLLPLGGFAPAHEVGERAEGDHVLGKERPGPTKSTASTWPVRR